MTARLNVDLNETNKEQAKQNQQIQLALTKIQSWANTIGGDVTKLQNIDTTGTRGPQGIQGIPGPAGSGISASGNYLPITGGELTGNLLMSGSSYIQGPTQLDLFAGPNGMHLTSDGQFVLNTSGAMAFLNNANATTTFTTLGNQTFNTNAGVYFNSASGSVNLNALDVNINTTGYGMVTNSSGKVRLIASSGIDTAGNIEPFVSGTDNIGAPSLTYKELWVDKINGLAIPTIVHAEIPVGDVDGSNNIYRTVGQIINNDVMVSKNGLVQTPTVDYTVNTSTITMATPPPANSKMIVGYHWDTPTQPPVWDANVVVAWKLQSDSLDSTTNGLNLLDQGNPETFTTTAGKACPTNFLTRGGFYISPTIPSLAGLETWTIEFEIYNTSAGVRLFTLFDAMGFNVYSQTGDTQGQVNLSNIVYLYMTTPDLATWFQVGIVHSLGRQKVYINGNLLSNVAVAYTLTGPVTFYIGYDWYSYTVVNSTIRNVVISNIARTSFPTVQV